MRRVFRYPLDFPTENKSEAQISASPQKRSATIEQQKPARPHVENSRQRRSNGSQAGNEFRNQQRLRALLGKKSFRTPHARIGLQRNLAKQLQYLDALDPPEHIPDRVCGQRGADAQQQRSREAELSRAR